MQGNSKDYSNNDIEKRQKLKPFKGSYNGQIMLGANGIDQCYNVIIPFNLLSACAVWGFGNTTATSTFTSLGVAPSLVTLHPLSICTDSLWQKELGDGPDVCFRCAGYEDIGKQK